LKNSKKLQTNLTKAEFKALDFHFETKKIRNFAEGELEKGAQLVNNWAFTCGIREPLHAAECSFALNFLKNQHKDFSFEEIQEAFEFYAGMKLEFKESHFQSFTNDFISKVLFSYKRYRNKALAKYHREKEKLEEEREPTPEELEAIEQDFLNNCLYKPYEKALKNGTDLVFEDKTAASIMVKMLKKGKISVTKEEIKFFRSKAKEGLKKSLRTQINGTNQKSIKNLIDKLELEEVGSDQERRIKERAAKYFLEDYFKTCVDIQKPVEEIKI